MSVIGFIKEIFSEKGQPSCKRVSGMLVVLVVCACVVIDTAQRGITSMTEGILQTMFVCACSLIGLYSVTNIFKKDDTNN